MAGPMGPQGSTGSSGPPPRQIFFPSKEGKVVARTPAGKDVIELSVIAQSNQNSWSFVVQLTITAYLVQDGERINFHRFETGTVLSKSPEELAGAMKGYLLSKEVLLEPEEVVAMFVIAKREAMKMGAVVAAEPFIGELGRDDMAEAWDAANVLSVMQE